jgi:4-hydroxy-2-oxoglutarate aldolase
VVKDKLSGVFPAVVTPFENDEVQYAWLEENLEKLGRTRLKGYLALGSNGEFMSLTQEEQIEVLKVIVKHKGKKVLMAGTARESTRETISFSQRAAGMGADFVCVLTPHYFARLTNDDVLMRYYIEVADNVPVPVLIYNAPQFAAGVQISASAVKELSAHPNIVGIKDSSPAGMAAFLSATRDCEEFHCLAGSTNFFLTALLLGATGGTLSAANYVPDMCCRLYEAFVSGDLDEARVLHDKLFVINKAVAGKWGVAGVKAAADIMGFRGGAQRKPFQPLDEAAREAIRVVLRSEGVP